MEAQSSTLSYDAAKQAIDKVNGLEAQIEKVKELTSVVQSYIKNMLEKPNIIKMGQIVSMSSRVNDLRVISEQLILDGQTSFMSKHVLSTTQEASSTMSKFFETTKKVIRLFPTSDEFVPSKMQNNQNTVGYQNMSYGAPPQGQYGAVQYGSPYGFYPAQSYNPHMSYTGR